MFIERFGICISGFHYSRGLHHLSVAPIGNDMSICVPLLRFRPKSERELKELGFAQTMAAFGVIGRSFWPSHSMYGRDTCDRKT